MKTCIFKAVVQVAISSICSASIRYGRRVAGYDEDDQDTGLNGRPSNGGRYADLDDSTRGLLEKARGVRSRPVWDEFQRGEEQPQPRFSADAASRPLEGGGRRVYNWEDDSFYNVPADEAAAANGAGAPADSTLSSKTRSILDKVKESTAALQGLNQETQRAKPYRQDEDEYMYGGGGGGGFGGGGGLRSQQGYGGGYDADMNSLRPGSMYAARQEPEEPPKRRKSRFLRSRDDDDDFGGGGGGGYQPPSLPPRGLSPSPGPSGSVHLLADDILSSASRGGGRYSRYNSREDEYEPQRAGGRASAMRYQRDEESPPPRYGRRTSRVRDESPPMTAAPRRAADDEDFDGMIADLKKKTSGRDMYSVLGRIEGRDITPPEADGGYGGGRAANRFGGGGDDFGRMPFGGDGGGGYRSRGRAPHQVEGPSFRYGSLSRNTRNGSVSGYDDGEDDRFGGSRRPMGGGARSSSLLRRDASEDRGGGGGGYEGGGGDFRRRKVSSYL